MKKKARKEDVWISNVDQLHCEANNPWAPASQALLWHKYINVNVKVFVGNLTEKQEFLAPLSELCLADCTGMFQSCYPDRPPSSMQVRLLSTKKMNKKPKVRCKFAQVAHANEECRWQGWRFPLQTLGYSRADFWRKVRHGVWAFTTDKKKER